MEATSDQATDQDKSNSSLSEAPQYSQIQGIVIAVTLGAIILFTIIGNILVCVAVCLVRKLRRPCNYLIVSLAVADLCVAVLVMPMATLYEIIGRWPFGSVICDLWVSFDVMSCTASILNLCMISVDRYLAITRPLDYGVKRTPKKMLFYVLVVWLGAALISVPPLLILGNEHHGGTQCIVCQNFGYQIYATLGSFYIPLAVMIVVYYKIFQAAKKITDEDKKSQGHLRKLSIAYDTRLASPLSNHTMTNKATMHLMQGILDTSADSRESDDDKGRKTLLHVPENPICSRSNDIGSSWSLADSRRNSEAENERPDGRLSDVSSTWQRIVAVRKRHKFRKVVLASERKASTTLGIIMSAFTVCWLPFFVLALIRPFSEHGDTIPHTISSLFLWLGYANSMLNPVIYATLNKDFRTPFKEILCLRCHSLNTMMREEFYQAQFGGQRESTPALRVEDGADENIFPVEKKENGKKISNRLEETFL